MSSARILRSVRDKEYKRFEVQPISGIVATKKKTQDLEEQERVNEQEIEKEKEKKKGEKLE